MPGMEDAIKAATAQAAGQQIMAMQLKVPPAPVAIKFDVGCDTAHKVVLLALHTPIGVALYHLNIEGTKALAAALLEQARLAESGLTIVKPGG